MSGTDPNGKWFGKKGDPTSPFRPDGAEPEHTQADNLPKIPGITLHYEIARGGMGVVYSGRQDFLDRRVAVKFLSVDLGGDAFAKRFQREAKILAGISHPNIVGCHMAGTTDEGQSFLVMEFIDGPSLKAWIQENGPVSPLASLRLVRATALALGHAHLSEIIHRDVKAENILLEQVTSTALDIQFPFTPKLVDLGLARMTHEQVGQGLTSPGSVMGTPATMSPEQFDDPDSVDFRSDIYGLGCVLYEMLVGAPAFRGGKLTDIVVRKREPVAPNPCDEQPTLPAALGAFVQRMLATDRDDRPASYKELDREADDLMKALLDARNRTDTIASGFDDALGQTGATIPGVPGRAPRPPADPTRPAPAPAGANKTAPGMLNTGELDFLREGADAPGGSAATAFREPGVGGAGGGGGAATTPGGGFQDTGATKPDGGGGGNKGLLIGVAAAAVVALGAGFYFGMGDGDDPNGGGGGPAVPAVGAAPVIAAIEGPTEVGLDRSFELSAKASDADGDALRYEWTFPFECMHAVGADDRASIRLQVDDGLPGVQLAVTCNVRDGSNAPVERVHMVTVADYEPSMPIIGFESKRDWKQEGRWNEITDPVDRGAAGYARGKGAVLTHAIGDDLYWEWTGTVEPTEDMDGHGIAAVEFTFGPNGYAVACERSVDEDTGVKRWTLGLLERAPGQDEWRPLPEPVLRRWTEPERTDNTNRAWFRIRRERARLTLQVGEFLREPTPTGEQLAEPTYGLEDELVVDLDDADVHLISRGQITLRVRQGRGEFRLQLF